MAKLKTKAVIENEVKDIVLANLNPETLGETVLKVGNYAYAVEVYVDNGEGVEIPVWVEVKLVAKNFLSVGDKVAYDGDFEREEYERKLAEKAEKDAEKAEKKAKKIALDNAKRAKAKEAEASE